MRTDEATTGHESAEIRQLAAQLDFLTDRQLQELAAVLPATTEAWRKRRSGPAFVRLGNAFFYPRRAVADFMAKRVKGADISRAVL
jgi:hypothetical protein